MKNTAALILSILLFCTAGSAQSMNWQWARTSSGPGLAEGIAAVVDHSGDVYALGGYYDSITFDRQTVHNGITIPYQRQIGSPVIARYSTSGTLLYAKTINVPMVNSAMAMDGQGYLYTTGGLAIDTVNYHQIACLAKFDTLGQVIWIDTPTTRGSYTNSASYGMAVDASGVIYTAGGYAGGIRFGADSLPDRGGAFMVRYSSGGTALWARSVTTDTGTNANAGAAAADQSGHVYFGGGFLGSDSIIIEGTTIRISQANVLGGYIVKYDTAGHMLWAEALESPGSQTSNSGLTIHDMKTDQTGNLYVAGTYYGNQIRIGHTTASTSGGAGALFIAKLDPTGQAVWIEAAGSFNNSGAPKASIAVSNSGQIFASFGAGAPVVWDGVTLNTNQGNITDWSIILSLDLDGHLQCAEMLAAGGDDGAGLATDMNGGVYLVGDYMDSTFALGTDTLQPKPFGDENIFVAKFNCPSLINGIHTLSQNSSLDLYPNPMTGAASVTYTLPYSSTNAQIIVSDILGRERQTYPLSTSDTEIQIHAQGLSSGVYFCTLVADGQILTTRKMIVE